MHHHHRYWNAVDNFDCTDDGCPSFKFNFLNFISRKDNRLIMSRLALPNVFVDAAVRQFLSFATFI